MTSIRTLLSQAAAKRTDLAGSPSAFRVCNGAGDSLAGVVIDRYGSHWQLQFFTDDYLSRETELIGAIIDLFAPAFLVVKYRLDPSGKALETPRIRIAIGDAAQSATVVEEFGCRFTVDLLDTVNPGLFLDMRDIRADVAMRAHGRNMLNLFSYTCSFGVHARKAGALHCVNADVSAKILEKGRANYALNGLSCLPGEFFRGDSGEYLDWALRKQKKFGVIVLDPPSFARHRDGMFSVATDMGKLLSRCVALLEPDGCIMASTNYSAWNSDVLVEQVALAFREAGRAYRKVWVRGQGGDFPGSGTMKESHLAAALVQAISQGTNP